MATVKILTDRECLWIERIQKAFPRKRDELTEWECKFIQDLLHRFVTYGDRTQISRDQWARITEISEKIIK
jgi:hypothetical protein